jgi:F0F1-type ATP synthase assembly protein I
MAVPIIGTIFFFITMIVFIEAHYKTRHKERMALIQMGRMPSEKEVSKGGLKFGILLLSLGLGVAVGNIFDMIFSSSPIFVFSFVFMMLGVGLIAFNVLSEKNKDVFKNWQNDDDERDEIV